jgi:hypothetical protein
VVEFHRHDGDLGLSVILPAHSALDAKMQAWRKFPENRKTCPRALVYLLDYAEIDWHSGRSIVANRKRRPSMPVYVISDGISLQVRSRRDKGGR